MKGYVRAGDAVVIHRVRHCREAAEPIAANDLHGLVTLRLLACVIDAACQRELPLFHELSMEG